MVREPGSWACQQIYPEAHQTACDFHFCSPPGTFPSVSELAIKGRANIWVFHCNLLPALWIYEEPGESQAGPERACASNNLYLSRDRTVLLPAAVPMLGWQKELSLYPRFCAARWSCRPLGRSTQHHFVLHRGSCSDSHLAEAKGHSTENHERTRVLALLTPLLRSQYCPSQSQSRVGRQQQTAMPRCWRLCLKRGTQEQSSGPGFGRALQPYVNILPAPPCPLPVPWGKTLSHTC